MRVCDTKGSGELTACSCSAASDGGAEPLVPAVPLVPLPADAAPGDALAPPLDAANANLEAEGDGGCWEADADVRVADRNDRSANAPSSSESESYAPLRVDMVCCYEAADDGRVNSHTWRVD